MKKAVIIVVSLIILTAGFYLYNKEVLAPGNPKVDENNFQGNEYPGWPAEQTGIPKSTPNAQTNVKGNTGADYTPPQSADSGEPAAPNIQVAEVDFDGTQFSPATINIKVNDWIFFKNKSSEDFWPASNPHPAHTDYPEFDAKQNIAPGATYKFQFTKVGNWGYHDNLNPSIMGTINVTK